MSSKPQDHPRRVVLDTNVLVGDAYAAESASARIVNACLDGRLRAVVSPALRAEYDWILPRAIHGKDWRPRFDRLMGCAEWVETAPIPNVIADDPSDNVLLATAVAGQAVAVVSNDRHLLDLGQYEGVRMITPSRFEAWVGLRDGA